MLGQCTEVRLGQLPDLAKWRQTAGNDMATTHDRAKQSRIACRRRLLKQLDNVLMPLRVAEDLFAARPRGLGASNLDLGMLAAILLNIPDLFIDGAEGAPLNAMWHTACCSAERGANTKSVDLCATGQEIGDRELIEVAAGQDTDVAQSSLLELSPHKAAVTEQVSAIQPNSGKRVAKGILHAPGDLDGSEDRMAGVVRVQEQGVAVEGLGDSAKGLLLGGKQLDEGMGHRAGGQQTVVKGGSKQRGAAAATDVGGAGDNHGVLGAAKGKFRDTALLG